MVRQLRKELAMCDAVEGPPFELTISVALIGIEESGEAAMSEIVNAELSLEILTEIPERSTVCPQGRSRMPKLTYPCLCSASVAGAQ
jgi:hypothetical protein